MKQSTPTKAELNAFASEYSWSAQMAQSNGLDSWSNYIGPDLGDLVTVVGRNRDSEILDESNFEAALEMLGGESKTVTVERFGHWGCGWFELLMVDPKDERALRIAFEIKRSLDNYPVLDEADFYEREHEARDAYADGAKESLAQALVEHLGLEPDVADDPDLIEVAYQLNVETQYQRGDDCCIDVYTCREPETWHIEHVQRALEDLEFNLRENPFYQYLCAALDVNQGDASKAVQS